MTGRCARLCCRFPCLSARIQRGDLSKKVRQPIAYSAETNRLIAKRNNTVSPLRHADGRAGYKAGCRANKLTSTALEFRRAIVLSTIKTLGKLSAAASYRVGLAPIEDAIQGALGKLPGIRT